jgi:ATP-dependent RNA helicase DeaD
MVRFKDIGIISEVLKSIEELGYEHLTPIQESVIPILLNTQEDLIGLAQTGTGKTAAFGLPLVQLVNRYDKSTQALILSPTRELCLQITSDLKKFAKYIPQLHIVAIYGGADIKKQIAELKKGAQIIVATPGRMNDLMNRHKKIDISSLQTIVLDEADEMLDMGFKDELDAIFERTPKSKNTLLFSATMPEEVLQISKMYMHNPIEKIIGYRNAGAENVEHICYTVRSKDRYLALKRILDYNPDIYGIIFCRTRMETKEIAEKLIHDNYNTDALHGDLSQIQREYIMNKFRIKNLQMLVATDVAARGLDVKDITHIINYNLPDENEVYIHRSGRTGRAGKKGISIAIVNLKEKNKIRNIELMLKKKFEMKPVPGGKEICEKQMLSLVDKMEKIEIDHKEIDKFLPVVYEKLEWLSREELIKHFVSLEFNKFLDYYKDLEDLNRPEEKERRKKGRKKDEIDKKNGRHTAEQGFTRFYINLGYKDSLTPRDLIGLINRCTRKRNIEIGKIDLMKTFSFFEVDQNYTHDILSCFKEVEYNHREVIVQISQDNGRAKQSLPQKKKRYRR